MTDYRPGDRVAAAVPLGWFGVGRVQAIHWTTGDSGDSGVAAIDVQWPPRRADEPEPFVVAMKPTEIEPYVEAPVGQGVDALERWLSA